MESVVLFDPSIRSLNLGDGIIFASAERELGFLTAGRFTVRCSTHSPVVAFYQNTHRSLTMRLFDRAKYKIVCGSNLLWKRMFRPEPSWNINPFNCLPYTGSILLGVGTHKDARLKRLDGYTVRLYRKVLNANYIHSARDEATKEIIEELGFKALNTGCPTMWRFTDEFCRGIPEGKARNAVVTLTYPGQNKAADKKMLDVLTASYERVWFWPQYAFDDEYFEQLGASQKIERLEPTLEAFSHILGTEDVDYVGTRLHGGMFAMQHKKRSIIIEIDNRAHDMRENYNFMSIRQDDIDGLSALLEKSWKTRIGINQDAINLWKHQFL